MTVPLSMPSCSCCSDLASRSPPGCNAGVDWGSAMYCTSESSGRSSAIYTANRHHYTLVSRRLIGLFNVPRSTGRFRNNFYSPADQTNSVKALKKTSWSWRSGLNCTRTTPPCYNNTTPGNRIYAWRKGPNVTNPICWTWKNCSYKCAADCEHCVTQSSTEQFW